MFCMCIMLVIEAYIHEYVRMSYVDKNILGLFVCTKTRFALASMHVYHVLHIIL